MISFEEALKIVFSNGIPKMKIESGVIEAVSTSSRKGVAKSNVEEVELVADWGIKGDAHAGEWHRQVSLLAVESIEKMQQLGADVRAGDFAENITSRGLDVPNLTVGDHLLCGETELEVTQIGKECHSRCAIYAAVGDCVMPREGVFARVVRGGTLKPGMKIERLPVLKS